MQETKIARYTRKLQLMARLAESAAELSSCQRATVAAVIAPYDCSIVAAIGYNGPAAGLSSCNGEKGRCGCAHAEANALVKLDSHRFPASSLILFSTWSPCLYCAPLIINCASVGAFLYRTQYRDPAGLALLRQKKQLKVASWSSLNPADALMQDFYRKSKAQC